MPAERSRRTARRRADLVGRRDEIVALTAFLDRVEDGAASTLVVSGVAGVGKSRLLDHASEVALDRRWSVVRAVGTEFEQEIAFTGLATIVGPHLDIVDRLDDRYARALRTALALDDASTPHLAVSVALLTFLATMAERQPVLVVVDDVQWLDEASASALHFATHRFDADRIAVLMGARTGSPAPLTRASPTLLIEGLSDDDGARLLQPLGVAGTVAKQYSAAVGGNPLALLELARRLTSEQRSGRSPLPDPVPLSLRLIDAFQPQLDETARPALTALEVAAIAGTADVTIVGRALHALGLDAAALADAERTGLVELGVDGLSWIHPLARASVQHNATPAARRAAHRAVAEVLDPDRAADQIAWHLAAAATGPDERVARRLDQVGAAANRRGALAASADAFACAAQLSVSDDARAERLLQTGQALWASGTSRPAADLMYDALAISTDPAARARIVVTLGEAVMWSHGVGPAVEAFEAHASAVSALDPALCAHLYVRVAGALIVAGEIDRALAVAAVADDAAQRSDDLAVMFAAATVHATARLLAGEAEAVDALAPITTITLELLPAGEGGIELAAQLAGFCACVTERWEQVEELIGGVIQIGEANGALGLIGIAIVVRADARFRSGRWNEAYADLTNVVSLIESTDETVVLDFVGAFLSRVEGARGMHDACRTHAASALETASRLGLGSAALWARHGLAVLELGAGRPERAVEHLDVLALEVRERGLGEPGVVWWQADYVEALLATDRVDDARRFATQLERDARRAGRGFAVAAAAWSRALLAQAGSDEAERAFADALSELDRIRAPFERARVLLARANSRFRAARAGGADGRHDLAEARAQFERLGARDWIERASAVPDNGHNRSALADRLTPSELRVALCVGAGASNQEAADQLFLSVKTVDYHLQNIYPKLEVRSRAQLAVLVASER